MNKKKYKNKLYNTRNITSLRELIDSSAELYSHKAAFLEKEKPGEEFKPVSYTKLREDVYSLGTALIEQGYEGERIALVGENSYHWALTYFAITCGVGTVVPLDRELKASEMAGLIEAAGVEIIVASEKMGKVLEEVVSLLSNIKAIYIMNKKKNMEFEFKDASGEKIHVADLRDLLFGGQMALEGGMSRYANKEVLESDVATIIFSSGTTGMAKGIVLTHKNLVANVVNMAKYVNVNTSDIGLSVLPMHHAYEMTCHILTGLYSGIAIAICEGLKHIQKNMVEAKVSIMLSVPLIFETIYKKLWKTAKNQGNEEKLRAMIEISKKTKLYNRPKAVKKIFGPLHKSLGGNIRLFIAGGAAINPKVIEDFEAMGFPMIQGYGMSENAPIIAVNKDRYSKAAAAGLPMPETEIRIINPDEAGVGEIVCRGPSVMKEYLNNPEATDETIVNGWLHTGDLGYFDKDGFLYVSGRKKSIIVTKNGKNIFPEEVEYYLLKSKYVAEALVYGQEDEKTGDLVVKAVIYPNYSEIESENGALEKEDIKNLIKVEIDKINEDMPLYKRVRRFGIRTKEFEKTTSRKIKRHLSSNFLSCD